MKKGKILSVLTSVAMAGSMMLSALSTTVSAAVPLGLKMTTDKASYKAGERATVTIDAVGTLAESDHIGNIRFELKPDKWGQTDVNNLKLVEENGLATDKGSTVWMGIFNPSATNTYSTWTSKAEYNEANDEPGYGILNIYDSDGANFKYDDAHPATVSISSDSNHGFLRTTGTGAIAEFVVDIPASLPNGKYYINFQNATAGVFPSGNFAGEDSAMTSITNTTAGVIVVGDGQEQTTATTQKVTTVTTQVTAAPHEIDGKATIRGEKGVKGAPGEEVYVPVYFELGSGVNPASIAGIGFQAIYDKSKLQLEDILVSGKMMKSVDPSIKGAGLANGAPEANVDEGVYINKSNGAEDMTVTSENPIALYKFKVKEGATGEVPITFVNHLHGSSMDIEIVHTQKTGGSNTYLQPTVVDGSVVIGSKETSAITTAAKIYDGSATIKGQKGVKGTPGEKVYVPVYFELGSDVNPASIAGIGFQAVYDTSKLTLSNIIVSGKMMKTVDSSIEGAGLTGGAPEANVSEGVYINKTSGTDDMTVNSSNPMCLLEFVVKDGATGEIPITFVNHLHGDSMPIEIVHTQRTGEANTYLNPNVVDGSVVVEAATTTTEKVTEIEKVTVTEIVTVTTIVPVTQIVTVTSYVPVTSVEVVTSISPVVSVIGSVETSIVPVTSYVPVTSVEVVTSISPVVSVIGSVETSIVPVTSYVPVTSVEVVTSIAPVTSYVPVTSISLVESVVGTYTVITSISVVPVTSVSEVTSIREVEVTIPREVVVTREVTVQREIPVEVTVTRLVDVPVEKIVTSEVTVPRYVDVTREVTVTKEIPVEVTVTRLVDVPVTSYVAETSYVPVTSYVAETSYVPVTSYVTVVSDPQIITSLVYTEIYVTEATTATSATEATTVQETKISFEIIGSEDIDNDDTHWYFEDEIQWHIDGIKVYVNDEPIEVTADDLVFSYNDKENVTPGDVYNKGAEKKHTFEVNVTYGEATATFTAKIGFRGDVNLNHATNVMDAAAMATDLAKIAVSGKTTFKDKFALFLANVDEGKAGAKTRDAYKPYGFDIRDPAALATWKANQPFKGGDKYTLYESVFKKKRS